MAARIPPEGLSSRADDERAALGARAISADRLSGHLVLLDTEVDDGRSQVTRRSRPQAARNLRQARYPLARAGNARRCAKAASRGRRGVRLGSVGTTFRKTLAAAGVIFCSISDTVRAPPEQIGRTQVSTP